MDDVHALVVARYFVVQMLLVLFLPLRGLQMS